MLLSSFTGPNGVLGIVIVPGIAPCSCWKTLKVAPLFTLVTLAGLAA